EFNDFPGIVVSGPIMDKEEGVYAYPPELNAELVRDNYKIYASEYEKVSHEEFYQEITEVTEKKFSYMMRLFEKESWDFFMAGFYYGDVLQHRFWQYMDPASEGFERNSHYSKIITNYMQMIDGYIGTFLERRPENCTMLIVSDHGLGYSKAKLDLNYWLYENNYMILKQDQIHAFNLPSIRKYNLYFIIQSLYKKLDFIPIIRSLRNWFWKKLPKGERIWQDVDWNNTKAYGSWYSVFLNLKGREPNGIVEPGEDYYNLREEIIKKMMDFRDPVTKGPVFKKIWRKEEIYSGPYVEKLPDLVIEFTNDSLYWSTTAELAPGSKIIDYTTGYSGAHVRNGILFGLGPGIRKALTVEGASLLDITPTILHLLDVSIPNNIDGRVLKEIFESDSSEYKREVKYTEVPKTEEVIDESIAEEEDQRVKNRLRGLGYLD
ncbi:alkaline phosphatase family protein, partial [Patescibacteria group bacterium]|nr:alkaline phosphatase family protein [Patescibacteria group bacterium]